jgi:hypothetical protein
VVALELKGSSSSTIFSLTGDFLLGEIALTDSAATSAGSTGPRLGIPAFSSETVRLRDVLDVFVAGAARVFRAGFAFSSSVIFAPRVRALETCVIFFGESGDD